MTVKRGEYKMSEKQEVIDINDRTVVIIEEGYQLYRINQLAPFAKDGYDYSTVWLHPKEILKLADQILADQIRSNS
jgi:hypothetical protein